MITDLLIATLALMLLAALPVWPYSRRWGASGAAGIGVILLLVLLLHGNYVL